MASNQESFNSCLWQNYCSLMVLVNKASKQENFEVNYCEIKSQFILIGFKHSELAIFTPNYDTALVTFMVFSKFSLSCLYYSKSWIDKSIRVLDVVSIRI